MNRNQEVLNSLKAKFEAREKAQTYVMSNTDRQEYENALQVGDIQLALSIKSGMATRKAMNEQFQQEIQNINIQSVVKELGAIQQKVDEINKAMDLKAQQLEGSIKNEFYNEEQQLARRGIFKNSRQHIMLQEKYVSKLNAIQDNAEIQELQSQLYKLQEREIQLKFMQDKYIQDNQDIINELKREKVRQNLQGLGLVD